MRKSSNLHNSDATAGKKFKADMYAVDDGMLFVELPPPPENLLEGGHFWWEYYGGLLIEAKCFSRMFLQSVLAYCNVCTMIETVERQLKEEGVFRPVIVKLSAKMARETGEEDYTEMVYNPLNKILGGLYDQHDRLAHSMGMTIYSSRVMAIDTSGQDEQSITSSPPEVDFVVDTVPFQQKIS